MTCQRYSVEVNYLNYLRDLSLYSPTNKHIRANHAALVHAFYEITGTKEEDLIGKAREYLEGWG